MNAVQGWYSIIQYCPDLSRLEAVNLGVLLFCPEPHFLQTRTTNTVQRIRRFFGSEDCDWEQIRELKAGIEERLEVERERFKTAEDLEQFVATRGNEIQLTPPRPIRVFHPVQDLEGLFRRLVGGGSNVAQPRRVRAKLTTALSVPELAPKLFHDVVVTVPAFHKRIVVPHAFQNGRFNLIQPVSFRQEKLGGVINTACRHAVEGRSLYHHADDVFGDLQLLVVGDFGEAIPETVAVAADILQENDVRLIAMQDLPRLVEEIRTQGKVPAE